jgi:hypothetical protein
MFGVLWIGGFLTTTPSGTIIGSGYGTGLPHHDNAGGMRGVDGARPLRADAMKMVAEAIDDFDGR